MSVEIHLIEEQEGTRFEEKWSERGAWLERARVMCKGKCAHDENARILHHLMVSRLFDEWLMEWQGIDTTEGIAQRKLAEIGDGIARLLIKMLSSTERRTHLKNLVSLLDVFPLAKPCERPDFDTYEAWKDRPDFKPTLQDGLKAVMLKAFFDLMKVLGRNKLPTIGELDCAIREKWKWSGDDKELRDARRELGLNGLPRGKGGRPKKQRGKK